MPPSPPSPPLPPGEGETGRELVVTWAAAVALLAAARAVGMVEPTGLLAPNLAGVAAVLFVVLPERWMRRQGVRWRELGLPWWGALDRRTWAAWGKGLLAALSVGAVIFPLFFLAFYGYARLLPWLPPGLAEVLAPYAPAGRVAFRWPPHFALLVAVQALVVALPEELFYRGWMQTRWAASDPGKGFRLLGATLGRGFLLTQVLFALGHLVVPRPWRLATFFPGLVFGWLRERTGGLAAPIALHALSNLALAALEASFYGG